MPDAAELADAPIAGQQRSRLIPQMTLNHVVLLTGDGAEGEEVSRRGRAETIGDAVFCGSALAIIGVVSKRHDSPPTTPPWFGLCGETILARADAAKVTALRRG